MSGARGVGPDPAVLSAQLSSAFDHAPWAVTELAGEAHTVRYANAAFCRLIGKARDEVIGRSFETLFPSAETCLVLLDRVFRTGAATSYTADVLSAPSPLLFSYNLWPVMAEGRPVGVIIQVNETGPIHETRQAISQALLIGALRQDEMIHAADAANERLTTEIGLRARGEAEARMLTNEVAHRVKNNLQVVAALIGNEIRRTPAPWVQGYLAMRDRIMAIALLYDLISRTTYDRTVALGPYLTDIAEALASSLLDVGSNIHIRVEKESLTIGSERALPFGLLVNELCTNAIKHAFPSGNGLVTLAIRRVGTEIELKVTDNGIGMAETGEARTPGKHGSDYIAIFVRQLRGVLVRSGNVGSGTSVVVRFPMSLDEPSESIPSGVETQAMGRGT
jgi:PAS domain S-box-containing protein